MDANRHYSQNVRPLSDEDQHSTDLIKIEQIRHLVGLLDRSDVCEIEVKRAQEGMSLVLRKAKMPESSDLNGYQVMATGTGVSEPNPVIEMKHIIVASLVGVFHTWAKPKGGTLVAIGDHVKVGQLVGTIQSLNVINEVESPFAGRVTEIFVQDGQAVEYGQQLMTIDNSEEA